MLQYIKSDQFGQYGESNKLNDIILEFIAKMSDENMDLQLDNEQLAKSNVQYEGLIHNHQQVLNASAEEANHFGDKIALSES